MGLVSIQQQLAFVTIECYKCGVMFAVSDGLNRNWHETKQDFFCPNGHSQAYLKSEAQRLREQLDEQKRQTEFQKARAERLDSSLTAHQQQLASERTKAARLKKRIAAGVCPVAIAPSSSSPRT